MINKDEVRTINDFQENERSLLDALYYKDLLNIFINSWDTEPDGGQKYYFRNFSCDYDANVEHATSERPTDKKLLQTFTVLQKWKEALGEELKEYKKIEIDFPHKKAVNVKVKHNIHMLELFQEAMKLHYPDVLTTYNNQTTR